MFMQIVEKMRSFCGRLLVCARITGGSVHVDWVRIEELVVGEREAVEGGGWVWDGD